MKRKQFIYIATSSLVLLSLILKGCYKPKPEDQNTHSYMDYDPRVNIAVSSISDSTAVISGGITNTAYSTITDCGIYWTTTENRIWLEYKIDNIKLNNFYFCDTLTGLIPNTIYYVAVAVKFTIPGSSIVRGDNSLVIRFETLPFFPVILTSAIIEFTKYSAVVGGMVTNQGMTPLIERGLYWGLSPNPETSGTKIEMGNELGAFSTKITGLSPNTNYYIKAYATNNNGTGYGSEKYFNTGNDTTFPRVTDVDSNVYHIVAIGNQVWMAENLRTSKFNDGTSIPRVIGNSTWNNLTSGAYCWYNNDSATYEIPYGKLYNWYAVNSGKLCPTGWHVPSDSEWDMLGASLDGGFIVGDKVKEIGTTHWLSPNTGATNESGFTALPGGLRQENGIFAEIGSSSDWWSSTEYNTIYVLSRRVDYRYENFGKVVGGYPKKFGFSIRCVND